MKRIIILLGVLSIGLAYAQTGRVGINTDTPNATLDVKSTTGRTTSATKNLELRNGADTKLVTVLDDGKVGIGTDAPSTKLHIDNGTTNGAIRITDGTEGVGKVLTSDANGLATWKALQATTANYTSLKSSTTVDVHFYKDVDTPLPMDKFTAPKTGKYLVIYHSFLRNGGDMGEKSYYWGAWKTTPPATAKTRLFYHETYHSVVQTRENSHQSTIINVNAGDQVEFFLNASYGTTPPPAGTRNPAVDKSLYIETGPAFRNEIEIIYIGE